jgi:Skp family chaperone for outer membrane proteins
MKTLLKSALKSAAIAGLMLGASASPPALAQNSVSGTVVPGLAVADLEGAIAGSSAYKTAQQQRQVTYKAQIDQANARRSAIAAQLQPLADKFNKDRQANVAQATLQQQAQQIQQIQEAGQQELQRIIQPVAYSEAYVQEQIEEKLDQAVKNAMAAKKVSLLLSPQVVLAMNNTAYNLTADVVAQLDKLIPTAQLVPPAGWEPRQIREARAQQTAQQGAAAATPAKPAGPQPQGR